MDSTSTRGTPVGVVVAARGSWAEVSTSRRAACTGCAEASSCGLPDPEGCAEIVAVRNVVGARPGDTVELDLPGHGALGLSLLVWGVPLLGLVGGAVTGASLPWGIDRDVATFLGAVVGASLAYGGLRRVDRRAAASRRLTPFIARILLRRPR